jgi:hypothetical protein
MLLTKSIKESKLRQFRTVRGGAKSLKGRPVLAIDESIA